MIPGQVDTIPYQTGFVGTRDSCLAYPQALAVIFGWGPGQKIREVQTKLLSIEEEEHDESAMTQAFFTRTAGLVAAFFPTLLELQKTSENNLYETNQEVQDLVVPNWCPT